MLLHEVLGLDRARRPTVQPAGRRGAVDRLRIHSARTVAKLAVRPEASHDRRPCGADAMQPEAMPFFGLGRGDVVLAPRTGSGAREGKALGPLAWYELAM